MSARWSHSLNFLILKQSVDADSVHCNLIFKVFIFQDIENVSIRLFSTWCAILFYLKTKPPGKYLIYNNEGIYY